jgi:hypothetical protein
MPTKRQKIAPQNVSISAAAIEAWRAGDFHGLNRAFKIRPWQRTPWPLRLTLLGADPKRPPRSPSGPYDESWSRAVEFQRALLEAAGEPPDRLSDAN